MALLPQLLGESTGIVALRAAVARLLEHSAEGRQLAPVLIQGETGTGKTVLAQAMHDASSRQHGPFVDLNAGAVAETLLEDQLFGHERGAFTDAREARPGFFQEAHGGTLFLDEVGLMSPALQGKLLKAIEERTVRRLGSRRSESVDVWVITASNLNLAQAVGDGSFRADLYYRIAGVTLRLPPLRERGDDILLLAEHFLATACHLHEIPPRRLEAGARGVLRAHDWPGNVRELARVMECAAVFSDGPVITEEFLRAQMADVPAARASRPDPERRPLKEERDSLERERLLEALQASDDNLTRAAQRLGIKRNTLRYRLQRLGLREQPRPAPARSGPPVTETSPAAVTHWEPRRVALLRLETEAAVSSDALLVGRAVEAAVEKIHIFGGRVEERSGTGVVATFGVESAADAPRRAAHAAMAVQKAAERARGEGPAVAVRLAIDVRRLQVSAGAGTSTIALDAKREAWAGLEALVARAAPGSVVVGPAAAPFLERRFDVVPLDQAGTPAPQAFRLVGHASAAQLTRAPATAFVGRAHHLELLQDRLAATREGRGQAVGVVGDAGIGKSRLLAEFCRSLSGDRVRAVEGACFPYASAIPYAPVLAIARQLCGVAESDDADTAEASVRRRLETLGLATAGVSPYLCRLLGLRDSSESLADASPEAIRLRTSQALRHLIVAVSRERPLVLIVEDLHWADPPSQDVLASLMEDLPGVALMMVATYRPGFRPPWIERPFATQIALPALTSAESLTIVRAVLTPSMAEAVSRIILDKAEGNPFFIEEICRSVQGHGTGIVSTVPDTVEDVLVARIQGLPADLRDVLQSAAVLGRRFAPDLLGALGGPADALEPQLAALTALEFVYQAREGHEAVYVFKHALTQEVAYASLSLERRRALHAAVGQALERRFADRLDEAYDRLAYHFARTEEAAKAVEYLGGFARRAARTGAHETAVEAWKEALRHVERLPPDARTRRRLEVLLSLPDSLLPLGRVGEAAALLEQERDDLEGLHDAALAARYHFLLARAYMLRDHGLVIDNAGRAIVEAERCGDDATRGAAYGVLAIACALFGQPRRGIECGRRAVALLEKTKDLWSLSYSHWALGLCCSEIGAFKDALVAQRRALEIGRAIDSPPLESSALWAIGVVDAVMGEWDRGLALCREAVDKSGDVLYRAINSGFLGLAYVEAGDGRAAIAVLEDAIVLMHQFGLNAHAAWFTAFLAEAHRLDGRLERAAVLAENARRVARETHFDVAVGWAQQSLGRIAAARGDVPTAQHWFDEALATFATTESRYETARTYLDLALMTMRCGDREVACRHLGAASALFEELDVPRYRERVAALAADWGVGSADTR